jgi:hypothetical protein
MGLRGDMEGTFLAQTSLPLPSKQVLMTIRVRTVTKPEAAGMNLVAV